MFFSRLRGARAEQNALKYLKRQGLKKIISNYACRLGEIDIIMQDRTQLVFIEVRYRSGSGFGRPAETVDYRKRTKIGKTALHFLQTYPQYNNLSMRFDVVAITGQSGNRGAAEIEWIKDAFLYGE